MYVKELQQLVDNIQCDSKNTRKFKNEYIDNVLE